MFKLSSLPIFVLGVALLGLTACDGGVFNIDGDAGKTCSTNPYLPDCTEPKYQELQVYYCLLPTDPEDSPDPECVNINVVDTRDIDGYTNLPTNFDGLAGNAINGFVKITGSDIATAGLTSPATGKDSLLDNDTDGYVYAVGENGAIAGILPNTDVGRPHDDRTPSADWLGKYSLVNKTSAIDTDRNITLKISFAPRTITGQSGLTDGRNFSVDATFNPYGDISGDFSINAGGGIAAIAGSVQGLIGTKGAVGALHGNNTADDNPVAGGFVATPQ